MIARVVLALAVLLAGAPARSDQITTTGWCSPAVTDTWGNVAINCQGVDPRALERLNELLDKKDLELAEKIAEAEDWARRYRELTARLAEAADDSDLAREAEELIQAGEFERAGETLDRLIAKQEDQLDRLARNHFNRAELFSLQFEPLKALPHYEKAHRYRPDDPTYAFGYATALHKQNQFREAQPVYEQTLAKMRELAAADPAAYRPALAITLNNLGLLYIATGQFDMARAAYEEAAAIAREPATADPAAYRPILAATLNNLGRLYSAARRFGEAATAYEEAAAIARELTTADPAHRPDLARTLNNLGVLYGTVGRFAEAGAAHEEAAAIRRELAAANPMAYRPDLARTLNNLGVLYSDNRWFEEAGAAFEEARAVWRELADREPAAFLPHLANTLGAAAIFYS